MDIRRSRGRLVATLVGESLREIAILVLVFAPLDAVTQGIALTLKLWAAIIVAVVFAFAFGVYLETK